MRDRLCLALGGALCLLVLYSGAFGSFVSLIQRPLFVMLVVPLGALMFPLWADTPYRRLGAALDAALCLCVVAACATVIGRADEIMTSLPLATDTDIWLCLLLAAAILEVSRRVVGPVFPLLVLAALGYARFGAYLPEPLKHRGFDTGFIVETLYLGDLGMWGLLAGVAAGIIASFTLMGAALLRTGGAEMMIGVATRVGGGSMGGGAKVAAISSALFGMVSGSAVANVATTGNFTIPMMRRLGYPPSLAAAVEAVASTGGQLAPPIMGAAAFVMAEIVGVDYLKIVAAATLPALLFYGGVLTAVHRAALTLDLKPLPPDQIPSWRETLRFDKGMPAVLLALGGLTTGILMGKSLQTAAFFGTVGALAGCALQGGGGSIRAATGIVRGIIEDASRGIVIIGALLACAQILVAMINLTGAGVSLSGAIAAAAGGSVFWTALIVAAVCLIIGMGMPTTAAYVLAAAVMAPALIRAGVEPLAGHLFVFYYATLSVITPPLCIAVFVAAGIAKEPWTAVASRALRLGAVLYCVPALFLLYPGLLLDGGPADIAGGVLAGTVLTVAASMLFFGGIGITGLRGLDILLWLVPIGLALAPLPFAPVLAAVVLIAVLVLRRRVGGFAAGRHETL